MEWKVRPWLILAGIAGVAIVSWVLFPSPFVRGIVVGAVVGPGVVIAGLTLLARRLRRRVTRHLTAPHVPVTSWDFAMKASDLEGVEIDFASFKGRVLVLNFWATWCAPCIAEMPSLARLEEATSDLDVELACVSRESMEVVGRFIAKRGDMGVPIFLLDGDPPDCFITRGIPATFVVDKNGLIVLSHTGAAAWDADSVVGFVRGLAAVPDG